jgi:hypothetical protein
MRTSRSTSNPAASRVVDDEMNEVFHLLLRQAAEKREKRQRTQAREETMAAKREFGDFLALARGGARAVDHSPASPLPKRD